MCTQFWPHEIKEVLVLVQQEIDGILLEQNIPDLNMKKIQDKVVH